jgi:NADH-quinone oxidoreductase subunit G
VDLTYKYTHLGSDAAAISKLAAGGDFLEALKKAQRPVLVVGPGVLNRCGWLCVCVCVYETGAAVLGAGTLWSRVLLG